MFSEYLRNVLIVWNLEKIWAMKRIWLPALSTQNKKQDPPFSIKQYKRWRNILKILYLNICAEICVQKNKEFEYILPSFS